MPKEIICSKCGKKLSKGSRILLTEDDEVICSWCAEHNYYRCSCDRFIDMSYGRHICKSCDENVYRRVLNSYSTKPIPNFKNSKAKDGVGLKTRYYGLEMEYSYVSPGAAYAIMNELYRDKWLYNKTDGSLSQGVEIVTSPMDKKKLYELMDKMADGFEYIRGCPRHTYNAGIHIHVTKNSVSPLDRYKLAYLLNKKCSEEEKCFLYYICNRISKGQAKEMKYEDDYYSVGLSNSISQIVESVKTPEKFNRHIAVNFSPRNTIEFRLFKSTTKVEEIKSYVEIVDMILDFCNKSPIRSINIPNLKKYIEDNSKNKILLTKIKRYNTLHKLFPSDNVYSMSGLWDSMIGVKYDNYLEIARIAYNSPSLSSLKGNIEKIKNNETVGTPLGFTPNSICKKFAERLEETVRIVYYNKILKEVDRCA